MATPLSLGLLLFESREERLTLILALGISLSLFGLTTIEALPKSPHSILSNEENLSFLYWVLLWLLSIHIVFVIPSLVGSSIGVSFGRYFCCTHTSTAAKSEGKKWFPWWILVAWRLVSRFFFAVFNKVLCKGIFRCYSRRRRRTGSNLPVLPLRDVSLRPASSGETKDNAASKIKKSSPIQSSSSEKKPRDCSKSGTTTKLQRVFPILGGICGIAFVLGTLSTIGPLVVQPPSRHETTVLSLIMSWICALGLLISAILNGFGSVSLPYANLSGYFLQVRPDYIAKLEVELRSLEETLTKKRIMLKGLKIEISSLNPSSRGTSPSALSGFSSNAFSMSALLTQNNGNNGFSELGDELRNRRQILQTEIVFMEELVRETALDLEELKDSQVTAIAARSSIGKAKSYVGIIFSVILLVRLFLAGFSVFKNYGTLLNTDYASHRHHHRRSQSDIVTSTLLWLTGHHYFSSNQHNTVSQMVSLVLSAVLSFTQMRLFLRTATIVHRRVSGFYKKYFNGGDPIIGTEVLAKESSALKPTGGVLWLIISAFLGCYSLACIVLIKMMIPRRFSVAFSMALNETSIFTIHSSVVDVVFFSSAMLTACVFGMLLGIQRQNILKHADILSPGVLLQGGTNALGTALPDV
eukprot:CAMPEP_0172400844 /NCGR_PEP_ID=MMETSP1061-20121228/47769_1 /TAXON_ID=37318 /ORGANISM="Pseudo-nitzschia pungens, Strain cf. pungens" /LENGTH=638 /DNA_ID=CAMNT_0013134267 /DNA_START=65 /DNA_END=1981 /DNA_ORIENTATION=-